MSEVSSDLVFHFTKSFVTLMLILENGFRPGVAIEDIEFMLPAHKDKISNGRKMTEVGIPMVCFTDIPLELSSAHRKQYGCYGLGLSKKWAIEKGLNPVSYVVLNSGFWAAFNHLQFVATEDSRKHLEEDSIDGKDIALIDAFMEFAGYMKVYGEGKLEKTFYDEREWRYLPPFMDNYTSEYCNRLKYDNVYDEEKKRSLVDKMAERYMLMFDEPDLKKIIIPRCEYLETIEERLRLRVQRLDPEELIPKIEQL